MFPALRQTDGVSLIVRTAKYQRDRQNTLFQNFAFIVNVLQQVLECSEPLLKPEEDLIPIVAGKKLWEQVARPRQALSFAGDFRRYTEFARNGVEAVFEFSNLGSIKSLQMSDEL